MCWLSRFAILLYLAFLCSPQAFAVHEHRVAPLADTQLQALSPLLTQSCFTAEQNYEPGEEPNFSIISSHKHFFVENVNVTNKPAEGWLPRRIFTLIQARAPPTSLTFI